MTNSRAKGARGELELVQEIMRLGALARRTQQYCGKAGDADIVVEGFPFHVEVKRTEKLRLADAVSQATRDARGKPWIIAHRQSHMPWLIIMPLTRFAEDSLGFSEAVAERKRRFANSAGDHPDATL